MWLHNLHEGRSWRHRLYTIAGVAIRQLWPRIRDGATSSTTLIDLEHSTIKICVTIKAGAALSVDSFYDPYGIIEVDLVIPDTTPYSEVYAALKARITHELRHALQWKTNDAVFDDYPRNTSDYYSYRRHPTEIEAFFDEALALSRMRGVSLLIALKEVVSTTKLTPEQRTKLVELYGDYNQQRHQSRKSNLKLESALGEGWYYRYTHNNGMGLMSNQALNYDKLSDREEAAVQHGYVALQQPSGVPAEAIFAFTEEGRRKHARLIKLLRKASRYGTRAIRLNPSKYDVIWQSTDGQIALVPRHKPTSDRGLT